MHSRTRVHIRPAIEVRAATGSCTDAVVRASLCPPVLECVRPSLPRCGSRGIQVMADTHGGCPLGRVRRFSRGSRCVNRRITLCVSMAASCTCCHPLDLVQAPDLGVRGSCPGCCVPVNPWLVLLCVIGYIAVLLLLFVSTEEPLHFIGDPFLLRRRRRSHQVRVPGL